MAIKEVTERLGIASALLDACVRQPYRWAHLRGDLFAGMAVGASAIPLSMALAIAIGLPPQHGLYTALIAGLVAALLGGSRLSVSGPTAAFVVILQPIVQHYGLSGLLLVTLLSGMVLILMALARFGRLISYIPLPVTLGFTLGIAIILVTQQLADLLGLTVAGTASEFYLLRVWHLLQALPSFHWPTLVVAVCTFLVMWFWPYLKTPVPAHLPALLVGVGVASGLALLGESVDTLASRFGYVTASGEWHAGVPPLLPHWRWPWEPGTGAWSWALVRELMPSALTVALLGAIQALLCAVMLDKMSGQRHHPNGELFAQGLSNLLVPFFGGFSASAALARSTTNFRAGASSPLAAVFHVLVVAVCLLWFTHWLAVIPMAAIAVLLVMVARSMCGRQQLTRLLRRSPPGDLLVFVACVLLTVLVDMVAAVMAGVLLSALLFMRDIARMTHIVDIATHSKHVPVPLPVGWGVYKISGPLFFAAANQVFVELRAHCRAQRGVILYWDSVSLLDAGGLEELTVFMDWCRERSILLVFADIPFQPLRTLVRAGIQSVPNELVFYPSLSAAVHAVARGDIRCTAERMPVSGNPLQAAPI